MNKQHLFRSNMISSLFSPIFLIAVASFVGFCFVSLWEDPSLTVDEAFLTLRALSIIKRTLAVLAALPAATAFCSEWNSRYFRFAVIRSGTQKYLSYKFLINVICSFWVAFLGQIIFAAFLSLKLPVYSIWESLEQSLYLPFAPFGLGAFPLFYLITHIYVFSMAVTFYSCSGMVISAYIPNRFVALATPFVFWYIVEEFSTIIDLPGWLNPYSMTRIIPDVGWGAWGNLAYYTVFFGTLMFIMGLLFYRQAKRRVQDEVS